MGFAGGGIIGGRGAYSTRKAFSSKNIIAGTKTAKQKVKAQAKTEERQRGAGGGGSTDVGRQNEAQMTAEFSSWRSNLTKDEVSAIKAYTNGAYHKINTLLRGDYKSQGSATDKQIKDLKSAFKHTLSKNVTVYRGTGTTDQSILAAMTTPGAVFRDKGAFSTSISKSFAKSWASSKDNAVVFTVQLPKGYKGAAWVHTLSHHKSEKEMLIKPGQNWKVVKELAPMSKGYGKPIRHMLIKPV